MEKKGNEIEKMDYSLTSGGEGLDVIDELNEDEEEKDFRRVSLVATKALEFREEMDDLLTNV